MSGSRSENTTRQQKGAMLQALEKTLGIVTTAVNQVGISRAQHYNWMNNDAEYRKAVEEITFVTKDFGESQLLKRMKEGSDSCIIFFMKTKCRDRGYIETVQHENIGQPMLPPTIVYTSAPPPQAPPNDGTGRRKPKS